MKNLLFLIFFIGSSLFAKEDNQRMNNSNEKVSEDAAAWLKETMKENPSTRQLASEDKQWLDNVKKNVSKDSAEWLREAMSEELSKRQSINTLSSNDPEKGCQNCVVSKCVEPKLYVFVSFSMPEAAWLFLSKETSLVDGVFVLRGIPNNSFKSLSERILAMKKRGFSVDVQINPKLFEDYAITAVPAFVVIEDKAFDKISGNISISFALDLIEKNGETSVASSLKNLLYERKEEAQQW